mgnify:CR=1 FL=1
MAGEAGRWQAENGRHVDGQLDGTTPTLPASRGVSICSCFNCFTPPRPTPPRTIPRLRRCSLRCTTATTTRWWRRPPAAARPSAPSSPSCACWRARRRASAPRGEWADLCVRTGRDGIMRMGVGGRARGRTRHVLQPGACFFECEHRAQSAAAMSARRVHASAPLLCVWLIPA